MLVQDQGVGDPQPLHVGGQDGGPLGVELIADQQALSAHAARDLGALAAGGGADVQDPLAGLRVQQGHRGHGAGLLEIVGPGGMVGMQAGTGLRLVIEADGLPGDRR